MKKKPWIDMEPNERHQRSSLAAGSYDVEELWDLMLAYLKDNNKTPRPNSQRSYKHRLRTFLEYTERVGINLLRPGPKDGRRYFTELEATLAINTRRQAHAVIGHLYEALRWCGHDADLLEKVRLPKPNDAVIETYSEDEFEELLREGNTRDRAMVLLAAHAGLKTSEAEKLQWKDVGEMITIRQDGKRKDMVRLSPRLKHALDTLRSEVSPDPDDLVLDAGRNVVIYRLTALAKRAGVRYFNYKALRHSAGIRLYEQTRDLMLLADHLRIKDLEETRKYADHVEDRDFRLQEALNHWTVDEIEFMIDSLHRTLGPSFSSDMLLQDGNTYLLAAGDLSDTEKARLETLIERLEKRGTELKLVQKLI